jgi:hypothetical protein
MFEDASDFIPAAGADDAGVGVRVWHPVNTAKQVRKEKNNLFILGCRRNTGINGDG